MKPCCVHCQQRAASRPRRLCWSCYHRPGVRDRYPVSKYAPRGETHTILPPLDHYPNPAARQRCPCRRGWEGECPACARAERARLPAAPRLPENADGIVAFVRGLRGKATGL